MARDVWLVYSGGQVLHACESLTTAQQQAVAAARPSRLPAAATPRWNLARADSSALPTQVAFCLMYEDKTGMEIGCGTCIEHRTLEA